MRRIVCTTSLLLAALVALSALPAAQKDDKPPEVPKNDTGITWKRTRIDETFLSEGVAVADVNKDGKLDILNGEAWYEAPTWKRHEIRKLGDYGDGLKGYSNSFACWADDLNGDGYPDLIVIAFPGAPCHWFENPKGKTDKHWAKHEIWHSACNETPQYVDLFGTGKRVLVMGWQPKDSKGNMGQMAYFKPGKDPTKTWVMHPISEPSKPGNEVPGTQRFSHGLGVGDVNGDKRLDVICTGGWWEHPESAEPDTKKAWKFHKANLGAAAADLYAYDITGDGKADILSTSAHKFGIWYHEQRAAKPGASPGFIQRDLFPKQVSETHAVCLADIDGDGQPDFVTGKRWWSHGRSEPGSSWPAMIYWFQGKKKKDGSVTFTPRVIDDDSGIGTQFVVMDINGDKLLDVVTSNKKGTFLLEQVRKK